ncbi:MAG: FUSC family protein [Bacteroidia bacterium]
MKLAGKILKQEIAVLFKLKQTNRSRHIPVLAALCIGVPLLTGLYFNNIKSGLIASLAGLVILYIPTGATLPNRMMTLLICSFGFMISYTIGICFSFNAILSAVVFGLFSIAVHYTTSYFRVSPPGNFFFIMIASMASCMPFDMQTIPTKIGLIGLGTMFACSLALIYSLLVGPKKTANATVKVTTVFPQKKYSDLVEAVIIGIFMFVSLLSGHLLELQNPYWVPISCLAVMQGVTLHHIWQRGFQRILGTLAGLALTWIILSLNSTPLSICLSIIALQFIVELLIVRNYALAVLFITPMTILLSEAGNPIIFNPDKLIFVRFWDIALGSFIGAIGGWFIHHEKLKYMAVRRIRKTRVLMRRI